MSNGGIGPAANPWGAGQFGPTELLARRKATADARAGANWFFWIVGLSMINSILALVHVPFGFLLGLTATQMIDGFAVTQGGAVAQTAAVADVVIFAIFLVLGVFSSTQHAWAFVIGIILYGLDSLLFANVVLTALQGGWQGINWFPLVLTAAIHVYALIRMFNGVTAVRRLAMLDRLERQYKQLESSWTAEADKTAPTYTVKYFGD